MDMIISPEKTAFFVIDMQVDFYESEGFAAKLGRPVNAMKTLTDRLDNFVQEMSKIGVLILFTKYVSGPDITPPNLRRVADKYHYALACAKGSGLDEISGVTVPENALIIEKPHYDAFAYTNLQEILNEHGITTVLVSGVRSDVCVDATAKRAASEGYETVIISDLVATYDDYDQIQTQLLDFFDRYYGSVITSEKVLRLIGK